jgi:outer membrane protein TolC
MTASLLRPFWPVTLLSAGFLLSSPAASAQISLTTAVDLAVRNNPRVKMALADVDKARAGLSQAKDVFIPAVNVGAGLGNSYGYSTNPPTLFTVTGQSLVYNSAQIDYIRGARASLQAAQFSLVEAQNAVAEDAALTFIALDHDQEREAILREQTNFASKLLNIVEERVSEGRDTQMDLTSAKLSAAQLRLSRLRAEDATADDRDHLARLMGLPATALKVEGGLPTLPSPELMQASDATPMTPAVAAAFASAHAKQELAFGDNRYLYRPQISLFFQYSRYATFANSFNQLTKVYGTVGANAEAYGVQITIPLFDKYHQAKARETAADAAHAFHEAENAQFLSMDGRSKLRHSLIELQARAEVAALEQQYSQLQLDALLVQLNAPSGNGPQMTPKDEQNSRIAEREKYLTVVDTTFQLRQAQINLLRQTGQLADWLKAAARTPATAKP